MLSANIRNETKTKSDGRIFEINPVVETTEVNAVNQLSPTSYALKNNSSMFDPSMMSQTPPGVFTSTLKERMRTYYMN